MISKRTIPVSENLICEALEYYWRSVTVLKEYEDVAIKLSPTASECYLLKGQLDAELTITQDKGVTTSKQW